MRINLVKRMWIARKLFSLCRCIAAQKTHSRTLLHIGVLSELLEAVRRRISMSRLASGLYLEILCPAAVPLPASLSTNQSAGHIEWEGLLWAVPKKRTSHSKKRMRFAHKYLKPKSNFIVCHQCKNLKLLHVLCGHCLKETLRQTAETRRNELEVKLQKLAEEAAQKYAGKL